MYLGFAIVAFGIARLLWSKRWFMRSKSQAIALPFQNGQDVLPFARPGTPSSRPSSPLSRSTTPNGRYEGNRSVLYYLPVWFMPPSERGPTSPSQERGSWSQILAQDQEPRYSPVADYSRPGSPSNNSILHAPGSKHDGAFDGVHLHSLPAPQPLPPPPSSPSSPQPPSYSSLRSWGTQFFRSPRAALEPLVSSSRDSSTEGGVEEEVDRLLSTMEPDVEARLAMARAAHKSSS